MKKRTILMPLFAVLLTGCGSVQKAKVTPLETTKKYEDASANCYQLQSESDKMLSEIQEILKTNSQNESTQTKRILWTAPISIPIILAGELFGGLPELEPRDLSNIEIRQDRIKHLQQVMLEKGCGNAQGAGAANSGTQQPAPKEKSRVIICNDDQSCVVE